jgi:pimeloyl-ACP methyl ester carboxylesterase
MKPLWEDDDKNMGIEFGMTNNRAIIIVLMTLLLAACGAAVEREAVGTRSFGSQEANVEEIKFRSGKFHVVGDLRMPEGEGPHPAIIMVHGSGNATRNGAVPFTPMIEIFLRNGYAVFSWDKPGSGKSTGQLDGEYELTQRATILADGIKVLVDHPAIDPARIGLWGLSQAGWVMPLALELTGDADFMIVVSGGAEDSIEQMAFQVGQQAIKSGGSVEQAALVEEYWPRIAKANEYSEYRQAVEILLEIPGVKNYTGLELAEEDNWKPWPRDIDAFIDPIEVIEHTTIPVLAFFGELDKNIDPVQGAEAYESALQKAGNKDYQIEFLPDVAHVFVSRPEYLETLEVWLQHLSQ